MANSGYRQLSILKYLYQRTDDEHYLTAHQIVEYLESLGIHIWSRRKKYRSRCPSDSGFIWAQRVTNYTRSNITAQKIGRSFFQ